MKGESHYKVSALMGNSPDICQKHYAALAPESLVDAVEFPVLGVEGFGNGKGLASSQVLDSQLVAGTGFEPATFGL